MDDHFKGLGVIQSDVRIEAYPEDGEVSLVFRDAEGAPVFSALMEPDGVIAVGRACAKALMTGASPTILVEVPNPALYGTGTEGDR